MDAIITVETFRTTDDKYLTRWQGLGRFDDTWGAESSSGRRGVAARKNAARARLRQLKGMDGGEVLRRNKNGQYMGRGSRMFNTTKGALRAFVNDMYAAFGGMREKGSFTDEILRLLFDIGGDDRYLDDGQQLNLSTITIAKCKAVMKNYEDADAFNAIEKRQIDEAIAEVKQIGAEDGITVDDDINDFDDDYDDFNGGNNNNGEVKGVGNGNAGKVSIINEDGNAGNGKQVSKPIPRGSLFEHYNFPTKSRATKSNISAQERKVYWDREGRLYRAVERLINVIAYRARDLIEAAERKAKGGEIINRSKVISENLNKIAKSHKPLRQFLQANTNMNKAGRGNPIVMKSEASFFYDRLSRELMDVAGGNMNKSGPLSPCRVMGALLTKNACGLDEAIKTDENGFII